MKNLTSVITHKFDFVFSSQESILIDKLFEQNNQNDLMKSFFHESSTHSNQVNDLNQKTNQFLKQTQDFMADNYGVKTRVGNWAYRNENGRVVESEGHVHVRDNIYFTSITTLAGKGPWYEINNKRYEALQGETVFFVEEILCEKYQDLSIKPTIHGSPKITANRLILLCSFLPVEMS